MDNEKQVIINLKSKITEKTDKNKKLISFKSVIFVLPMMLLIFPGIIILIYINKKELTIKVKTNQIKCELSQNETKAKIINLENKINILENKIDNLTINFKEQINNNKNISKIELSEISFEKFDENILQQIKSQQKEFCNNENKY